MLLHVSGFSAIVSRTGRAATLNADRKPKADLY
jgi:hypothetical protein